MAVNEEGETVTSAEEASGKFYEEKKEDNVEAKADTENIEDGSSDDSDSGILEKKAESSEDPIEDEVAKDEEDKSQDESKKEDKDEKSEKIEYTLKVGEESLLGKEAIAEVQAFAEANKLSNEAAQSMLDREEKLIGDYVENSTQAHDLKVDRWADEVEADAVMGGNNFEATKVNAQAAVKRFGGEELGSFLRESGYGNNPTVVRFLSKIGAALKSDSSVQGGGDFAPLTQKSAADKMYG